MSPVQDDEDEEDEEVNFLDYIYDIPPKAGAKVQRDTRYTHMAPNEKNNRVSKKKHYITVEEAKQALIQAAGTRDQAPRCLCQLQLPLTKNSTFIAWAL